MGEFNLTIAFKPSRELVGRIKNYIRENFSKEAVLNVAVDKGILGGAITAFNGKYKDASIKKKLYNEI